MYSIYAQLSITQENALGASLSLDPSEIIERAGNGFIPGQPDNAEQLDDMY